MTRQVQPYSLQELEAISQSFEGKTPQEILRWAVDTFYPDLSLACSFGGTSGMVLLDMVMQINPNVEVFYLDTDFLFPETYDVVKRTSERYGFSPKAYKSLLTPEQQAQQYGEALWARNPDQCCALRKVEPNKRAMEGKRAWITGIRRDQAKNRGAIGLVEWDSQFNLVKVNPLAAWNERQVWTYIVEQDVSYNPLHDQGYPSIGCTYCTKPVNPGDDPRSGRWADFDKTECGIHLEGEEALDIPVIQQK